MSWSRSNSSSTRPGALARVRRFAFAGVLASGAALTLPALTTAASATTVCPSVGVASDCGVLITINPDASVSITTPGNGNPYDGNDDTLVGVVNNSSVALSSIGLTSTKDIFGFDGDGMCTYSFTGDTYCNTNNAGNPSFQTHNGNKTNKNGTDPFDYQGPTTSFSNISADKKSGTVVFDALAGGASTYFSLENNLVGCADGPCVTIPTGPLTVNKTDDKSNPLNGGTYAVFTDASPHAGSAVATCTITAGGTCTTSGNLDNGVYYVDETVAPTGFTAAAEQKVLVLGGATVTFVDTPIVVPPPVVLPSQSTTTTTTTTVTPATAVAGATAVHTGESFAGSAPYVVATLAVGGSLIGLGLARRRCAQRRTA